MKRRRVAARRDGCNDSRSFVDDGIIRDRSAW